MGQKINKLTDKLHFVLNPCLLAWMAKASSVYLLQNQT